RDHLSHTIHDAPARENEERRNAPYPTHSNAWGKGISVENALLTVSGTTKNANWATRRTKPMCMKTLVLRTEGARAFSITRKALMASRSPIPQTKVEARENTNSGNALKDTKTGIRMMKPAPMGAIMKP